MLFSLRTTATSATSAAARDWRDGQTKWVALRLQVLHTHTASSLRRRSCGTPPANGLDSTVSNHIIKAGAIMHHIRKTASSLVVWATVVSTLVGNAPHFVCRCPDGTIKPFCFGSSSKENTCCCSGGSCCCSKPDSASPGNSNGEHPGSKSCCQKAI